MERLERVVERMNFAKHLALTHPARDELGNLGAKVQDQYLVVIHALPIAVPVRPGAMGFLVHLDS